MILQRHSRIDKNAVSLLWQHKKQESKKGNDQLLNKFTTRRRHFSQRNLYITMCTISTLLLLVKLTNQSSWFHTYSILDSSNNNLLRTHNNGSSTNITSNENKHEGWKSIAKEKGGDAIQHKNEDAPESPPNVLIAASSSTSINAANGTNNTTTTSNKNGTEKIPHLGVAIRMKMNESESELESENLDLDLDNHLQWFQEQRNVSQNLTLREEPVQLFYRALAGMGHQLIRLSSLYHMAKIYKIPHIHLTANPVCGGDIKTIYDYLIGPGPVMVDLPFSKVDELELIAQAKRLRFPPFQVIPDDINATTRTSADSHPSAATSKREIYVVNEVPGYHKYQVQPPNSVGRRDYEGKEATDLEMYQQLMLLFKHKHQGRVQEVLNATNFNDHTVFALHIRAGNGEKGGFARKNRSIDDFDQWIQNVMKLLCNYSQAHAHKFKMKPMMVFVGTDTASALEKLKHESLATCKLPVVSAAQEYPKDGAGHSAETKSKDEQTCLRGWESMFLDMYFFTRSNSVIAGKYSSFTQSAPLSYMMEKAKLNNVHLSLGDNDGGQQHPHYFCEIGSVGDSWECFDTLPKWIRRESVASFGNMKNHTQHPRLLKYPQAGDTYRIKHLFKGTALQNLGQWEDARRNFTTDIKTDMLNQTVLEGRA